jgi:hypothetical protein
LIAAKPAGDFQLSQRQIKTSHQLGAKSKCMGKFDQTASFRSRFATPISLP